MASTRFTRLQWHWTAANESLFALDAPTLHIYNLLIREAAND